MQVSNTYSGSGTPSDNVHESGFQTGTQDYVYGDPSGIPGSNNNPYGNSQFGYQNQEYCPSKPEQHPMVPNLSVSQWLLADLILWLPIVGLVMKVIWAVGSPGDGKECLVNYSRAALIWMLIKAVLSVIVWVLLWVFIMAAAM